MGKYKPGDTVYIIENNLNIKEVIIRSVSGGFCVLKFVGSDGGTRLREDRLFSTKEDAAEWLRKKKNPAGPWG